MSWTLDFFRQWLPRTGPVSAWRIRRHFLRQSNPPHLTTKLSLRKPLKATVRLREWGSDFATFGEIVEDDVYRVVCENIPHLESVIDLGANVGLASLYFATRYPACRILAVEPQPDTFRLLQENLRQLHGRAQALNVAVWSRATTVNGTETDRYSAFRCQESRQGSITALPLTELINRSGFSTVDLLKIDIEGAETELFRETSWLSSVRAIAIEFHSNTRVLTDFDSLMKANGFRVVDSGHTTLAVRDEQAA